MTFQLKQNINELPATLYSIYIFKVGLSYQDIESIKNTLKRYTKKYTYISYLLVESNTDSKHCVQRKIMNTNRKGRPKTCVLGNKIPTHIHLSILGDSNHSAYAFVKLIIKVLDKRFNKDGKKQCYFRAKGRNMHAKNFILYSLKQASHVYKNGIFNEILEKRNVVKSIYF